MNKKTLVLFLLISLAAAPVLAQDLVVSAAASLTAAFDEIKREFEKANPNVRVVANYASSGALFRQLQQGAPADLYASANVGFMEKLIELTLVDRKDSSIFAYNDVVLAVRSDNRLAIDGLQDLKGDGVRRIGIGNPATVPAGQYAMKSLKDLGLWEGIESRLIYGETVTQVLRYIRRGEVDAGFLFASDLKRAGDGVLEVSRLPLEARPAYPIAVVKGSRNRLVAEQFLDWVLSETGQAIMEKHGFAESR